jgi:hypothetical protein
MHERVFDLSSLPIQRVGTITFRVRDVMGGMCILMINSEVAGACLFCSTCRNTFRCLCVFVCALRLLELLHRNAVSVFQCLDVLKCLLVSVTVTLCYPAMMIQS